MPLISRGFKEFFDKELARNHTGRVEGEALSQEVLVHGNLVTDMEAINPFACVKFVPFKIIINGIQHPSIAINLSDRIANQLKPYISGPGGANDLMTLSFAQTLIYAREDPDKPGIRIYMGDGTHVDITPERITEIILGSHTMERITFEVPTQNLGNHSLTQAQVDEIKKFVETIDWIDCAELCGEITEAGYLNIINIKPAMRRSNDDVLALAFATIESTLTRIAPGLNINFMKDLQTDLFAPRDTIPGGYNKGLDR